MLIIVSGPYSAETEADRRGHTDALNKADGVLLVRGHIPVVGMNAAHPVVCALDTRTSTKPSCKFLSRWRNAATPFSCLAIHRPRAASARCS